MRIGIFGGTFDPVHLGHLLLAESAREQRGLDEVWFVPAAEPPHKRNCRRTEARHRVEMLKLAVGGHEAFRVCELEIERGGVSFTVETLEQIGRSHPEATLFLLVGADTLADLPNWREPARVCELALPTAVGRPGSPPPDVAVLGALVTAARLAEIEAAAVEMPLVGISATDLRSRAASGRSLRYRTPRAVERYIETHGLYR